MIKRVQKIFKVESFFRLAVIFTVFAITGSLSVYLGNPELDPSGRDIPDIRTELSERLRSKSIGIRKMSEMDEGESGKVSFISLSHEEIEIM